MGRYLLIGACSIGMALVAASSASSTEHAFAGNLCSIPTAAELSAAHISAKCVKAKTATQVQTTPLGSVQVVAYGARWGGTGTIDKPTHGLSILVTYVHGSAQAVAMAQGSFRKAVVAHGIPFSKNPLGSDSADTSSCTNPSTDDCNRATALAIVGQYDVEIFLNGPAPFVNADDPANPAVDDKNDTAQEGAATKAIVPIAKTVMAAL